MPLRRAVVCVCVLAIGALGLTACGGDKPSGLPLYTAGSGSSSSPTPTPTPTSKWTTEQQAVLDGYDRYTDLRSALWTKTAKVNVANARRVAKEPFATEFLKRIDASLSAGFVQRGKVVNTPKSVIISGSKATIQTCFDQTHTSFSNPGTASTPAIRVPPPSFATVTLVRDANAWLVAGFKGGGGPCVSG